MRDSYLTATGPTDSMDGNTRYISAGAGGSSNTHGDLANYLSLLSVGCSALSASLVHSGSRRAGGIRDAEEARNSPTFLFFFSHKNFFACNRRQAINIDGRSQNVFAGSELISLSHKILLNTNKRFDWLFYGRQNLFLLPSPWKLFLKTFQLMRKPSQIIFVSLGWPNFLGPENKLQRSYIVDTAVDVTFDWHQKTEI